MKCCDCVFNHSGNIYNRCHLTGTEYYHEFSEKPCTVINDNYIFIEDCEPMGFIKGKSAIIEYMKGGAE